MVAGAMFGIPGMILGTPIFATIYTLVGRKTRKRIAMKGEKAERVINMDVIKTNRLTNVKRRKKDTKTAETASTADNMVENKSEDSIKSE